MQTRTTLPILLCTFAAATLALHSQPKTSKSATSQPALQKATKGKAMSRTKNRATQSRKVASAPEIADYKKWQVANAQAFRMAPPVAALCAAASPPTTTFKSSHRSTHPSTKDKFIRVFVNEKGTEAMFQRRNPRFPEDSVIVKEKLPAENSIKPELLTVMIKRRVGYDPKKGDWEYLVSSGDGKQIYQRGQLSRCQSCHVTQRENDYVFRSYVPVPFVPERTEVEPSINSRKESTN